MGKGSEKQKEKGPRWGENDDARNTETDPKDGTNVGLNGSNS